MKDNKEKVPKLLVSLISSKLKNTSRILSIIFLLLSMFCSETIYSQNTNLFFLKQNFKEEPPIKSDIDMNFWLDADDIIVLIDNNQLSLNWKSKKFTKDFGTALVDKSKIIVHANIVEGHKVLELNGLQIKKGPLGYESIGKTGSSHTIFLVARKDQKEGRIFTKQPEFPVYEDGESDGYVLGGRTFTDGNYAFDGAHNSVPLRPHKLVLLTYMHKPDTPWHGLHLFVNSALQNSMNFTDHSYNGNKEVIIGDSHYKIFFAEIIIYNKLLSDVKRIGIEKYLMNKWKIY